MAGDDDGDELGDDEDELGDDGDELGGDEIDEDDGLADVNDVL